MDKCALQGGLRRGRKLATGKYFILTLRDQLEVSLTTKSKLSSTRYQQCPNDVPKPYYTSPRNVVLIHVHMTNI